jgi:hypothetical protein
MKQIFGLLTGALMATLISNTAMADAKVGAPAPAFEVKDADGKVHSLSSFAGKTIVLEWLNHDCPFVKKHYDSGNMQKIQESAVADGIVWLSVVSSVKGEQGYLEPAGAKKLALEKKSKATAVLIDDTGVMGKAYGAKVTPHMYVIDGTGKLVYNGAIDNKPTTKVADVQTAEPYLVNALAALKKGEPIKNAANKPYGCSVKYK